MRVHFSEWQAKRWLTPGGVSVKMSVPEEQQPDWLRLEIMKRRTAHEREIPVHGPG